MSDRPVFICFRALDSRVVKGIPHVLSRCSRCRMAVSLTAASWDAAMQMKAVAVCTHCLTPEEMVEAGAPLPLTAGQAAEVINHLAGEVKSCERSS